MKFQEMKTVVALAAVIALGGCDIFEKDNYDEPTSVISGQLVYNGQPLPVRNGAVQLELWQPNFGRLSDTQKMQVFVKQDGTFSAVTFDGDYEINVLAGNYPWPNAAANRIPITLNGTAEGINVPVNPYYSIQSATITRVAPTAANPGGGIRATFRVNQRVTTPALEFVALYVGNTAFVDQVNTITISDAVRRRTRAQVLTQLNANADITIEVPLPADIYKMAGPEPREYVFARVGVKTQGITEWVFTQVQKIPII